MEETKMTTIDYLIKLVEEDKKKLLSIQDDVNAIKEDIQTIHENHEKIIAYLRTLQSSTPEREINVQKPSFGVK